METRHQRRQLECGVCFQGISLRGKLNCCDHPFCVDCISQWAKTENTCPLCKRRFVQIDARPARTIYSDRIRRRLGSSRVQEMSQASTGLISEYYQEQLQRRENESGGVGFLYYLMALEWQLDHF